MAYHEKYIDIENSYLDFDIDDRVIRVCKEAEESYLDHLRIVEDIRAMKNTLSNLKHNQNNLQDSEFNSKSDNLQNLKSDIVDTYAIKDYEKNNINNNLLKEKTNKILRNYNRAPGKYHRKCLACRINKNE
jgi:hypothetical protein